jgi:hypothetical protein
MMNHLTSSASATSRLTTFGATVFAVPAKHNPKLSAVVERINADEELWQWWRCANVNAVERLGLDDHGEVHIRIVANAALKLLRLLCAAGQLPGAVAQHHLSAEEAEVIVVLAAALHDVGLAVHGEQAGLFGPMLTHLKAKELLSGLYPIRKRAILMAEVMHAITTQQNRTPCLTLEAGVLTLANALDLAAGRARWPGALTPAVSEVLIRKGQRLPVCVELRLAPDADGFPVDDWLSPALTRSALSPWVEVVALSQSALSGLPLAGARL